jgi:hypothetical protein
MTLLGLGEEFETNKSMGGLSEARLHTTRSGWEKKGWHLFRILNGWR